MPTTAAKHADTSYLAPAPRSAMFRRRGTPVKRQRVDADEAGTMILTPLDFDEDSVSSCSPLSSSTTALTSIGGFPVDLWLHIIGPFMTLSDACESLRVNRYFATLSDRVMEAVTENHLPGLMFSKFIGQAAQSTKSKKRRSVVVDISEDSMVPLTPSDRAWVMHTIHQYPQVELDDKVLAKTKSMSAFCVTQTQIAQYNRRMGDDYKRAVKYSLLEMMRLSFERFGSAEALKEYQQEKKVRAALAPPRRPRSTWLRRNSLIVPFGHRGGLLDPTDRRLLYDILGASTGGRCPDCGGRHNFSDDEEESDDDVSDYIYNEARAQDSLGSEIDELDEDEE